MAIVTMDFASFGSGAVVVNFDYNDNNGNVVRFRCINSSAAAAYFRVIEVDPTTGVETQRFERTVAAGQTVTQNVAGIALAWDTVDGGLNMGNYQFQARWPA